MASLTVTANPIEVRVPDIGDFHDIPVIELLVKPGDLVVEEQTLVTLESDKATLDIPSPKAGRVASLAVEPGRRVSQGTLILMLVPQAEPAHQFQNVEPVARTALLATVEPQAMSQSSEGGGRIYTSPSLRRLGRELGVDLSQVKGTGRGGRIMLEDLYQSVREKPPTPQPSGPVAAERVGPPVNFAKFGEIERQPLSRIRRISGAAMAHNWATIPHVTNFDEADITDLEAFRVKLNQEMGSDPKVTILPFVVKAIAAALRVTPAFNASLDGDHLILKKYINVGVAVDTPTGLVVPVIRNADQLGIIEIARDLSAKAIAAQAGKLKPVDFEGGCLTISSLGGVGGTGFTPIINAPEIAILGVTKATIQPRYSDGQFVPRLILPLVLSWDHRATDGVAAARFLVFVVRLLEDFRRISL